MFLPAVLTALVTLAPVNQPQAGVPAEYLTSNPFSPGIPMSESDRPIHQVTLYLKSFERGKGGAGILELGRNPPAYSEVGFIQGATSDVPPLRLEVSVKFLKTAKVEYHTGNVRTEEFTIYELTGPKLTTRLTLAAESKDLKYGRLLIHDKNGKVQYAVGINTPPPPEPCHPGCFPAGIRVTVSGGTRPIEALRAGDVVTSVKADGTMTNGIVAEVFTTTNYLVEVRTDAGLLLTTDAQPLQLPNGTFHKAGDLKHGDSVLTWRAGKIQQVEVREVVPTQRRERVFNLILKDAASFVANGFVARGKPPAEQPSTGSK